MKDVVFKCLSCTFVGNSSSSLSAHIRYCHISVKNYYDKHIKRKDEGICACGKRTPFISLTRGYAVYCSYGCVYSKDSKRNRKVSISNTGKEKKRGYKQTKEHIKKRVLVGKSHPMYGKRGELSPTWKGGKTRLTNTFEYKEWRTSVFERDNYICQICGQWGGTLHAHHIYPFIKFPSLRFESWNGITLCKKCHWWVHSKKNLNQNYLEKM